MAPATAFHDNLTVPFPGAALTFCGVDKSAWLELDREIIELSVELVDTELVDIEECDTETALDVADEIIEAIELLFLDGESPSPPPQPKSTQKLHSNKN